MATRRSTGSPLAISLPTLRVQTTAPVAPNKRTKKQQVDRFLAMWSRSFLLLFVSFLNTPSPARGPLSRDPRPKNVRFLPPTILQFALLTLGTPAHAKQLEGLLELRVRAAVTIEGNLKAMEFALTGPLLIGSDDSWRLAPMLSGFSERQEFFVRLRASSERTGRVPSRCGMEMLCNSC